MRSVYKIFIILCVIFHNISVTSSAACLSSFCNEYEISDRAFRSKVACFSRPDSHRIIIEERGFPVPGSIEHHRDSIRDRGKFYIVAEEIIPDSTFGIGAFCSWLAGFEEPEKSIVRMPITANQVRTYIKFRDMVMGKGGVDIYIVEKGRHIHSAISRWILGGRRQSEVLEYDVIHSTIISALGAVEVYGTVDTMQAIAGSYTATIFQLVFGDDTFEAEESDEDPLPLSPTDSDE